MSKSGRQSNLFAFFNRTPRAEKDKTAEPASPAVGSRKRNDEAANTPAIVNDDGGINKVTMTPCQPPAQSPFSVSGAAKRRRIVISSDEEEEDEKAKTEGTPIGKRTPLRSCENVFEPLSGDDEMEAASKPKSAVKRSVAKSAKTPGGPKVGSIALSFINSFGARDYDAANEGPQSSAGEKGPLPLKTASGDSTPAKKRLADGHGDAVAYEEVVDAEEAGDGLPGRFPHLDYDFLQPTKICDAKGRRPGHADYDSKTLHVPDSFLRNQTPGHQQWWKFKSDHYDTILFFKVGKFYELYHMDAVVAVEALNLTFMRGKYAHCGFPEIGYGRFADQLINRGHKVARVEQTETPQQLEERCRRTNVREKVVRREICRVTTFATRTYGVQDGTDDRETDGVAEPEATYLMAITERSGQIASAGFDYGVAFVDCATGRFYLSQFHDDDDNHSGLRTLLAHNCPSQILYENNALSASTQSLLRSTIPDVPQQALRAGDEFWVAEKTLGTLADKKYFAGRWPNVFLEKLIVEETDGKAAARPQTTLAVSALGALIWFLKECLIDVDLVTMRHFELYTPASIIVKGSAQSDGSSKKADWRGRAMILDGTTLTNLHILPTTLSRRAAASGDTFDASFGRFSLFHTVNRCATAFGRRLLQRWLCTPACDPTTVRERQRAIGALAADWSTLGAPFATALRKVPDLERLFQRIHTIGLQHRAKDHPDARAQLFEATRYNQRKVKDLVLALDGLRTIADMQTQFVDALSTAGSNKSCSGDEKRSELLERCVCQRFEQLMKDLKHFQDAFDRERALAEGVIEPRSGIDAEYDAVCESVRACERRLQRYLTAEQKRLNCDVKYVGSGKTSYQMEIPESKCANLTADYTLVSQRKGFKRFTTPELEEMKTTLSDSKRQLDAAGGEVTRRVFQDFDERKKIWEKTVENIATFDCVLSLANYAVHSSVKMTFPTIAFDLKRPYLEIRGGYHPALLNASSPNDAAGSSFNYIPNDCVLGDGLPVAASRDPAAVDFGAPVMLLTGPNMGGKSTLMRQIAALVVLAQMGSMVPATEMIMTPVDRIFCRIGASDRLAAGQSTFYVELAETSVILREATEHSLVLVDELGRGTSTHDGTAIAFSVLKHLAAETRCRTVFATHYHSLCQMIRDGPTATGDYGRCIKLAHMACIAENENTEDPTEENVTFLYTLTSGPATKSYGFYTAKMAGVDVNVVRRAFAAANRITAA